MADCDAVPGIGFIMQALDVALGTLKPGIELAFDPDLPTTDPEWAAEFAPKAAALIVPGAAIGLVAIDLGLIFGDLPIMIFNGVATPGIPDVPGWTLLQQIAFGLLVFDVIMMPINLMVGIASLEIGLDFDLRQLIIDALPSYAAGTICVDCMLERLGPVFG
jgi:hypothetical protein